jgi:hypothetical protein
MKKLFFALLMIVFFYGCEKDNSDNYSTSLIGKWSWIISCGGFAGCSTPESTHTRNDLVFTADSIYSAYQNDSLIHSCRFHVWQSISRETNDTINILGSEYGNQTFSIKNDTLRLETLGIFTSTYKRIK